MPFTHSRAITSFFYDDKRRELRVAFRGNRRTYIYEGVPREAYEALLAAESQGAHFNLHIRDRYPFRQIDR
jgi:hypothetical protein